MHVSVCVFLCSKKAQGSNALGSLTQLAVILLLLQCLRTLWSKSDYVFMYCLMGIKQLSTIDKCNKNVNSLRNTVLSKKCNLLTLTLHAD